MKPFPIPVTMIGPGSQPEGDAELHYMEMPSGMNTYHAPQLPEREDVENMEGAQTVLKQALDALNAYQEGDGVICIDLGTLDKENIELVNQLMGLGEVSANVKNAQYLVEIQESVYAGVWRVRYFDHNNRLLTDQIEVGAIPDVLLESGKQGKAMVEIPEEVLAGAINSQALLNEIVDQLKTEGSQYVINLTLLPFSPEDGMFMDAQLGRGEATILSRGYGNCRITATGISRVWWVQFFNSSESLILNTIEITDMPEVALAAMDDIKDSALRLAEVAEWIN